jgi:hypothetical protein
MLHDQNHTYSTSCDKNGIMSYYSTKNKQEGEKVRLLIEKKMGRSMD